MVISVHFYCAPSRKRYTLRRMATKEEINPIAELKKAKEELVHLVSAAMIKEPKFDKDTFGAKADAAQDPAIAGQDHQQRR